MLRSKKFRKPITTNANKSPHKTITHEHTQTTNITNQVDNNNNNSYIENNHICNTKTSKIHFKIPDFPKNNNHYINNWFETCINLFRFNNINNERIICTHIINQLPHEILSKINSKLGTIAKAAKPLIELQETLNLLYPYNMDRVLEDCYKECSLGDRKPSEFLAELTHQLRDENNQPNTTLIRFFFHRILPVNIKNILLANKVLTLEEQGTLADQIYTNELNSINALTQKYHKKEVANETIEFLIKKIDNLNEEIKTLKSNQNSDFHEPITKTSYQRFTNHFNTKTNHYSNSDNNTFCFYHNKYGNKAYKCTPPCNFKNKHLNTNSHLDTHQN